MRKYWCKWIYESLWMNIIGNGIETKWTKNNWTKKKLQQSKKLCFFYSNEKIVCIISGFKFKSCFQFYHSRSLDREHERSPRKGYWTYQNTMQRNTAADGKVNVNKNFYLQILMILIQWNPNFRTSRRNENCMVRKIGEFEKSEVKSQRSTEERSSYQAGRKMRVPEMGFHCLR